MADPRIRSLWGRMALAFGVFLLLANLLGFFYLLATGPWDPGQPDLEALAHLLDDPRVLGGLLTAQALGGVLTALFMAARVDRRPLGDLGVRGGWGGWSWGLLLGCISAAVVSLFITAVGGRHVQLVLFDHQGAVDVVLLVLVVLGAAFMEEFLFRGYLYVNLREAYPVGPSVLLSSLAFGATHASNPGTGFLAWTNVFLVGIVLGQLRELTAGILMPLGLHLGWNLSLGMLFGVRVSGLSLPSVFHLSLEDLPPVLGGGDFGPEASVVLTVLFAVMALLLARRLQPRNGGAT